MNKLNNEIAKQTTLQEAQIYATESKRWNRTIWGIIVFVFYIATLIFIYNLVKIGV